MPGPAPKPMELKRLDGYPDKGGGKLGTEAERDAYFEVVDKLAPVGEPYPDMSERAKAKWYELQRDWYVLLKQTDRDQLRLYCETWANLMEAQAMVAAFGTTTTTAQGGIKAAPWAVQVNQLRDQCRRMLADFGANPAARQRVGLGNEPEKPKTKFGDLVNH